MTFARGDFAMQNGAVCVVVGVGGDPAVPEDHIALWYGKCQEGGAPEVWTVPAEYVDPLGTPPTYCH